MVYSNFNTPSKNMRLSLTEINEMNRKQEEAIYNADKEHHIREAAAADRDREAYYSQMQSRINDHSKFVYNRTAYLGNVKEAFLSECIMKLYCDSMVTPMTKSDKIIARNLVNNFVRENGAGNLITDFSTKNILLSEFSRITQKYYDMVLEANVSESNCPNSCEFGDCNLPKPIVDNFYTELINIDTLDASKMIKDRVSDAIQQFIDDNAYAKMEYEDIIQQTQDKIATVKDESLIEDYSNMAKRRINEKRLTRPKNVFNAMVESLTRKVITDDSYKAKYMHEATVNMDSIVEDIQLMYTMLEMVNTTNMVNVGEDFISRYLKSLA